MTITNSAANHLLLLFYHVLLILTSKVDRMLSVLHFVCRLNPNPTTPKHPTTLQSYKMHMIRRRQKDIHYLRY